MSYFDSINSFNESAQAIQGQTENAQQAYREKKASTVEEKFDYVDKLMNESGGAIGGLGGGYHIGFKMYKKVKNARATAKKAVEDAKKKLNGSADSNKDETETDATSNDTPPQNHTKPSGEEDTGRGDAVDSKVDTSKVDTSQGEGKEVDAPTEPALPPAEGEISLDPISVARAGKKPATLDDSGTDLFQEQSTKPLLDQFTDSGSNISDAFTQGGFGGKKPMTKSNVETDNGGPAEEPAGGTPHDADVPQTAPNVETGLGEDADSIVNKVKGVSNKVSSTIDDIKGGVSDLKGTIKSGAEKMIGSDAVEAIGGVADFLGPVGELVGAGLALGSFFHNVFDKKKKDREEEDAERNTTGQNIVASGGISTASLAQASLKSNVVGTLV
tara:strand:+ start:1447 stop:2604 length:1158 start_codon:yes stop_codon:yes gene_type:complete